MKKHLPWILSSQIRRGGGREDRGRRAAACAAATMSAGARVFELGSHNDVRLISVEAAAGSGGGGCAPPPKPLLIASPESGGKFPVLVFLHGYLLYNSFYSQLMRHVASHGFIVVAPQLYLLSGPDATDEIKSAASTIDWLAAGLSDVLPATVEADLTKLGIAGHSRGGKVAFALALGRVATTSLRFQALMGIDPVDGMGKGMQTPPPVLSYVPRSLDVGGAATMVVGTGLGEVKRNPLFPACAPRGVNHRDFFDECRPPACYFVARDYGHLDMLDNETPGARGKATYCLCKNGPARAPMRAFVGGVMVAFMRAHLEGEPGDLLALREDHQRVSPVDLSAVTFLSDGKEDEFVASYEKYDMAVDKQRKKTQQRCGKGT